MNLFLNCQIVVTHYKIDIHLIYQHCKRINLAICDSLHLCLGVHNAIDAEAAPLSSGYHTVTDR